MENMVDLSKRGRKGGLVGGRSKSPAKARTARKNGSEGGRERKSTLAEHILRRKLTPKEHEVIREGFLRLTKKEREHFREFFGLPLGEMRKNSVEPYFDPTTVNEGVRPSKSDPRMRHILRKFRLVARWRLAGHN
jgi:hypothetical protein